MFLQAKLKCDYDGTPYRVYINEELITERFFSVPPSVLSTIKYQDENGKHYFQPSDVTNVLRLEIKDAPNYSVIIENLTDKTVRLEEWTTQEKQYEN